jgi:hypothetical protein
VASYVFSVTGWEVQTTMHLTERNSAHDPFDVQVIAFQEDLRSLLRNSSEVVQAEDAGRVLPWHLQRPRAYLFQHPGAAVGEFFDAVGDASVDVAGVSSGTRRACRSSVHPRRSGTGCQRSWRR